VGYWKCIGLGLRNIDWRVKKLRGIVFGEINTAAS
jgi:hypothetical protein